MLLELLIVLIANAIALHAGVCEPPVDEVYVLTILCSNSSNRKRSNVHTK